MRPYSRQILPLPCRTLLDNDGDVLQEPEITVHCKVELVARGDVRANLDNPGKFVDSAEDGPFFGQLEVHGVTAVLRRGLELGLRLGVGMQGKRKEDEHDRSC